MTSDDSRPPELRYRDGLAVLRYVREAPPWMDYDPRADAYVAPGHRLPEVRSWAEERGLLGASDAGGATAGHADRSAPAPDRLEAPLFDPRRPRDYQREALERWSEADGRGSVVLPTGSGKTFVAILAIDRVGRGACVVAPTRALVAQWFGQLADAFGAERIGAFYGDEKEVRPITVTTYHSAFTLLERRGSRFDLLVLDEAHHLADTPEGEAKAWHDALRIAPAARRLGLTATYPDGRDRELRRLVGPVVYRKAVGEMADAELAAFSLERRFVPLTPGERDRYRAATDRYEAFVDERGYRRRYPAAPRDASDTASWSDDAWRVFMAETRRDPAARRAFRAYLERERIVDLAENKLREAERILRLFPAEQAILFCGRAEAAERLSRRLAIPMIEASTPASERKALLDEIAAGRIRAVASVRVLDEGWDVPAAKLGLVLGDTSRGGRRQHAQRLGRLLRRQGDRVASLYEIVVSDTHEFFASQKRRSGLGRAGRGQLGLGL